MNYTSSFRPSDIARVYKTPSNPLRQAADHYEQHTSEVTWAVENHGQWLRYLDDELAQMRSIIGWIQARYPEVLATWAATQAAEKRLDEAA